jgi:predicted ATPase/class 3 adenylate cyclase/tRNA A-37 threonylcarbamoyl transferase component Bud32
MQVDINKSVIAVTKNSQLVRVKTLDGYHTEKTYNDASITPKAVETIKHEARILQKINSAYVIKFIDYDENASVLREEFFDGTSLSNFSDSSISARLEIAIHLAQGLAEIHQCNIIHKDINPDNILVSLDGKTIKYIDFGISALIGKEYQFFVSPACFEGTLAFASPEQTGRISRPMDYRTDIYSLGVTLYYLFTRQLPFEEDSPLELMHAHIAKIPKEPYAINSSMGINLSSIIMKCLAKDPNDRYKSAIGLKQDLIKCRESFENPFPLGETDVIDHFKLPTKLYGREADIHSLLHSFLSGKGDVFFVYGYSGVGKTSLINEIRLPIAQAKGFFIKGKFEQFKKEIPLLALKQALKDLLTQLLTLEEKELTFWKENINQALGNSIGILVELVPDYIHLLGEKAIPPKLNTEETVKRLHFVLSNLFEVFANHDQALVICIEDAQWIDEASMEFFEHFIETANRKKCLTIFTYRDNEINSTHALKLALDRLTQKNVPMKFLEVTPLGLSQIEQMIKENFRSEGWQTEALAKIVLKKTDGNPFFIGEFLRYLYCQDLFDFNPATSRWEPSLQEIESLSVTENVADLMTKRLNELDETAHLILKTGAAIGQPFSDHLISIITQLPQKEVENQLIKVAESDLLIKHEHTFSFAHDRIQQAAYLLLETNEKSQIHYAIAKHYQKNQPDNAIEIVDHYNEALDLISPNEKEIVRDYNFRAGLAAKASGAFVQAASYFINAMHLLPHNAWKTDQKLAYSIYTNAAICEQTLGKQNESEEYFNIAIDNSETKLEKAEIYSQMMLFHMQKGEYKKGMEFGYKALALYDYYHEPDVSKLRGLFELIRTEARALFFTENTLRNIPEATNPDIRVILQIMSQITFGAFNLGMDYLCFYTLVKMYRLTMKYGMTDQGLLAMSLYSCTLTWMWFKQFKKGFRLSRIVLELIKRYPNSRAATDANLYIFIMSNRWGDTFSSSIEALKQISRKEAELGNIPFSMACFPGITAYSLLSGMQLFKVSVEIDFALIEAKKNNDLVALHDASVYKGLVNYLEGKNKNKKTLYTADLPDREIAELSNNDLSKMHQFNYQAFQLWINYQSREYEQALNVCNQFLSLMCRFANFPTWSFFYLFYPLTLCAIDLKSRQKTHLKTIRHYEKIYEKWSKATPNYLPGSLLITAERLRLEGKHKKAEAKFKLALEAAQRLGFLHEEGLISERFFDYCKSINDFASARLYLKQALNAYSRWGALAFVENLKKENQFLMPSEFNIISTSTTDEFTLTLDPDNLDVTTIVNASQAISKEIKLNKLVEILMRIIIVSAGADKAMLILNDKGNLIISAEASLNHSKFNENIALESANNNLCLATIAYVIRSKETLILKDPSEDGPFIVDPYVINNRPQSIAVIPLVKQSKITGIIYLENSVSKGAFTEERLRLLNMLSSQIAISIENAYFYSNLEFKINERTQELKEKHDQLQSTLKELQKTQEQLIIEEKLKEREIVRNKMGRYVPNPQIMQLILDKGLEMRGEEKEVSILFCDIREFTTLSEKLSPKDTVELLNSFFSSVVPIITKHGGFIDKYIGDAFMAVFGALEEDSIHHTHSVDAAKEVIQTLKQFNQRQIAISKPPLRIGIGINSGKVLMGNIGGGERLEYTVIGDVVNVACRVESMTKADKIDILITEDVKSHTHHEAADRGEILVKGHVKPIHIYEVKVD